MPSSIDSFCDIPSHCPVCATTQPPRLAEVFRNGRFWECTVCGVYFTTSIEHSDSQYYDNIWGTAAHTCTPYAEKRAAMRSSEELRRLVQTIPRFRWVIRQLQKLPTDSCVLELGCGEGAMLWAAQELGHDVHGCDIAANAVTLAKELVGTQKIHVGTIDDVPYSENTFDALIMLEVLEHVPRPRELIEKAQRLLRPGGTLLLTTPNRHRVFAVVKRTLGRRQSSTDYPPHHLTRWSRKALRYLLEQYFQDITIRSLRYDCRGIRDRSVALCLHLATGGYLGQSLCAVAHKRVQ